MMKWLLFLGLQLLVLISSAQYPSTLESTLDIASEQKRPVLLYFSGSDWCIPCIKFKRTVLADPSFQRHAKAGFHTYVVDFPRKDTASAETKAYRNQLAERYNPRGAFPHFLLLDHQGNIIWQQNGYKNQSPSDFLRTLRPWLPNRKQP